MGRRWIIRGSLLFLLTLLVVGWGVSTCYEVRCMYCHGGNIVGCSVRSGEVCFHWGRGNFTDHALHAACDSQPFQVIIPDSFRYFAASIPSPGRIVWRFRCMGFDYEYNAAGLLSARRFERRWVCIPIWFLILVTGAGLFWAWKKTRPKLDPRAAFPVEIAGGMRNAKGERRNEERGTISEERQEEPRLN